MTEIELPPPEPKAWPPGPAITLRHLLPTLLVVFLACLGGIVDRDPEPTPSDGPQFLEYLEAHPEILRMDGRQVTIP